MRIKDGEVVITERDEKEPFEKTGSRIKFIQAEKRFCRVDTPGGQKRAVFCPENFSVMIIEKIKGRDGGCHEDTV
ncbi:MAG: hypothetical protein ACLSD6_10435 [Clostridium sp.]